MNSVRRFPLIVCALMVIGATLPTSIICPAQSALGASAEGPSAPAIGSEQDASERRKAAIDRCESQIEWYRSHKGTNRIWFHITTIAALVFAGIAPVVIAMERAPKWVQSLLPAIAAISVGLAASFGFRDNWVRFGMAEESLKSELAKFQTRTTRAYGVNIDNETALSNFVERVESILVSEATQWRTQLQSKGPEKE